MNHGRCFHLAFALSAGFFLTQQPALAADNSAVVRRVIGEASSKANTKLPEGAAFMTGAQSKAEIGSSRGLMRVGEKAVIEVQRSGIALRRGVTLVASHPGAFRKTLEVRVPGYRAKVKGTAKIEYEPGRSLKIAVLEGSVTVALDSLAGEFETLLPGHLLIINPSDKRLPEPVEVDLGRLVATSQMIGGSFGKLSTQRLIDESVLRQGSELRRGDLEPTQFFLAGTRNVLNAGQSPQGTQSSAEQRSSNPRPDIEGQGLFSVKNDLADPQRVIGERIYASHRASYGQPGRAAVLRTSGARATQLKVLLTNAEATPPRLNGKIRAAPQNFGGVNKELLFRSDAIGVPGSPETRRLQVTPNADIRSPRGVGLSLNADGLDIAGSRLQAGNGKSRRERLNIDSTRGDVVISGGARLIGGEVAVGIAEQQAAVPAIIIDGATIRGQRGVTINSTRGRSGIVIRNSSELTAIVNQLALYSRAASLTIEGSKLFAGGEIVLDSQDLRPGGQVSSVIHLKDAQLMADTIRVRAFSPDGNALIIDGSLFEANQLIRLYAEGASILRFRNHVTLNTPNADLAAKTVEVDRGGSVDISGRARVFTDLDHFNRDGYGSIKTGGSLEIAPFKGRPSLK